MRSGQSPEIAKVEPTGFEGEESRMTPGSWPELVEGQSGQLSGTETRTAWGVWGEEDGELGLGHAECGQRP